MLVDVVCLRREGIKLPPEELRAVTPVRAFLTIDTVTVGPPVPEARHLRKDMARLWHCDLCEEGSRPLDGLECARVSRIGGDALLLVGVRAATGRTARPVTRKPGGAAWSSTPHPRRHR